MKPPYHLNCDICGDQTTPETREGDRCDDCAGSSYCDGCGEFTDDKDLFGVLDEFGESQQCADCLKVIDKRELREMRADEAITERKANRSIHDKRGGGI